MWPSSLGAAYTSGVSSLLPLCLCEVWEREDETLSVTSQLMYCRVQDWPSRERNGTGFVSDPRSPGGGQFQSRKFSRTVRSGASPQDATRIEIVPRLLRKLVYVLGTKIIRDQRAPIVLRSSSSYTKELTCKLDCSRNARVKLSPILDVWLVQESFLREEFSVKISPKFYSTSFIRSSCVIEEKSWTTNLQTLKGEKITPARAW